MQVLEAKPTLKEALQAEAGLPINPDIPVFGFIGRLEEQKGSDILAEAVPEILKDDVQVIILVGCSWAFQNICWDHLFMCVCVCVHFSLNIL
jgi:glycogen synthase